MKKLIIAAAALLAFGGAAHAFDAGIGIAVGTGQQGSLSEQGSQVAGGSGALLAGISAGGSQAGATSGGAAGVTTTANAGGGISTGFNVTGGNATQTSGGFALGGAGTLNGGQALQQGTSGQQGAFQFGNLSIFAHP